VVHANAALTPRARLRLARLIVDDGWSVATAARYFHVSWPTAKRWADRYAAMGEAGMLDRPSRPHTMPTKTPEPVVRKIVHLRWKQRLSPIEIGAKLDMPASTVHAVLHEALGIARPCGAVGLVDAVGDELSAAGVPGTTTRYGVDALTPSELPIARLAAGGASDRQIAQELYLTVKTIEMHLSSVYRKLGVSARTQLSGALPG
jgi:DNA-binding CsgD family transcriptional regulator